MFARLLRWYWKYSIVNVMVFLVAARTLKNESNLEVISLEAASASQSFLASYWKDPYSTSIFARDFGWEFCNSFFQVSGIKSVEFQELTTNRRKWATESGIQHSPPHGPIRTQFYSTLNLGVGYMLGWHRQLNRSGSIERSLLSAKCKPIWFDRLLVNLSGTSSASCFREKFIDAVGFFGIAESTIPGNSVKKITLQEYTKTFFCSFHPEMSWLKTYPVHSFSCCMLYICKTKTRLRLYNYLLCNRE